ncbi:MAG: hypothetical protein KDN20_05345 [Verrucomicrobiae bacterium]|nr:hypothetical protein [Verrucomicrobiae bacterium]
MKVIGGVIMILSFVVFYFGGVVSDNALGKSMADGLEHAMSDSAVQDVLAGRGFRDVPKIDSNYQVGLWVQHTAVVTGALGAILCLLGFAADRDGVKFD